MSKRKPKKAAPANKRPESMAPLNLRGSKVTDAGLKERWAGQATLIRLSQVLQT
jgi:hypothetical protein